MTSSLLTSYLGEGLLASRPSTPAIDPACCALWWATDQPAGSQLSVYAAGAWTTSGGGYNAGAPPTVVQFGSDVTGAQGVTLGIAPTNGNLLVAMTFNPVTLTSGSGWSSVATSSGGTDFGAILVKIAGAGESTTQNPLNTAPGSATGAIAMWEIAGRANPGYLLACASQTETGGIGGQPVAFPLATNCLGLSAVSVVTPQTISKAANVGTQDVLSNSANRRLIAGHITLAQAATAGIMVGLSASGSTKGATCVITAP